MILRYRRYRRLSETLKSYFFMSEWRYRILIGNPHRVSNKLGTEIKKPLLIFKNNGI